MRTSINGRKALFLFLKISWLNLIILILLSCQPTKNSSRPAMTPTYPPTADKTRLHFAFTSTPDLGSLITPTYIPTVSHKPTLTITSENVSLFPLTEIELIHTGEATWSPDSNNILITDNNIYGTDDLTYLFNIQKLKRLWQIADTVGNASFTPDGTIIVSGDRRLRFFNSNSGKLIDSPYEGNVLLFPIFLSDGNTLLIGRAWDLYGDGKTDIGTWDSKGKKLVLIFQEEGALSTLAVSHDNKFMAASFSNILDSAGYKHNQTSLWNWETKSKLCSLWGDHATFNPQDSSLAVTVKSPSGKEALQIYDPNTCNPIKTVYEADNIGPFSFSPQGDMLALASGPDSKMLILNASTGELISEQNGKWDTIWQLEFSPDGQYLMSRESYGSSEKIHIWKINKN